MKKILFYKKKKIQERSRSRVFFMIKIILLLFFLASCSSKKTEIHIGLLNTPLTLRSWENKDGSSAIISYQIHRGLIFREPVSGILEGFAAKSWTISKDLLSIDFKLRENIIFHDGSPLTCGDIKKSFERLLLYKNKFPQDVKFRCDDKGKTFIILLPFIPGNFFTYLSSLKTSIVKEDGITGIGPYKIESQTKRSIILQNIHDVKKSLIFHIDTASQLIKDFQEKKIDDLLYLGFFQNISIECKKISSLTPTSFWFTLNSKKWAFGKRKHRRAFKMIVEDALKHSSIFNDEYKIKTLIPWGILGHTESNLAIPKITIKNPHKILKDLVKIHGKIKISLREINRKSYDWTSFFSLIDPNNELFDIEYLDTKLYFEKYYAGALSVFFLGVNIILDDPFEILKLFRTRDSVNPAKILLPVIDELYKKSAAATNIDDIKAFAITGNRWILENAHAIPLFSKKLSGCIQPYISGLKIGTLGPLKIDYSKVHKR